MASTSAQFFLSKVCMAEEASKLGLSEDRKQVLQDYVEAPLKSFGRLGIPTKNELKNQGKALEKDIDNLKKVLEWGISESQDWNKKRKIAVDWAYSANNGKKIKITNLEGKPVLTITFKRQVEQSSPSSNTSNNNNTSNYNNPRRRIKLTLKARGSKIQTQPVDNNLKQDNKFLDAAIRLSQWAKRHCGGRLLDIAGNDRYMPTYVAFVPVHVRAYQARVEEKKKAHEEEVARLEGRTDMDTEETRKQALMTPPKKSKVTPGQLQLIRRKFQDLPRGPRRDIQRDTMKPWTVAKKTAKFAQEVVEKKHAICGLIKQIEQISNISAMLDETNDTRPKITTLSALPRHIKAFAATVKKDRGGDQHGDGYGNKRYFDDKNNWYQTTSKNHHKRPLGTVRSSLTRSFFQSRK